MKDIKIMPKSVEEKGEIYWAEQVELQIKSRLSGSEYCRKEGVSYAQFVYWSKKLRKKAGACLIPVQIEARSLDLCDEGSKRKILCTLNLKTGHELEIHDEKALLQILKELK